MTRYRTIYAQYQFGNPPDGYYFFNTDAFDHPMTYSYLVSNFPSSAVRLAFECNDPIGQYSIYLDGDYDGDYFCSDGLLEIALPRTEFTFQSIVAGTDPLGYQHWVYLSDTFASVPTPTPSSVYLEVRADDPFYGARPIDVVLAGTQIAIFMVLALLLGLLVIRNKV